MHTHTRARTHTHTHTHKQPQAGGAPSVGSGEAGGGNHTHRPPFPRDMHHHFSVKDMHCIMTMLFTPSPEVVQVRAALEPFVFKVLCKPGRLWHSHRERER